jgi:hypothetical protein
VDLNRSQARSYFAPLSLVGAANRTVVIKSVQDFIRTAPSPDWLTKAWAGRTACWRGLRPPCCNQCWTGRIERGKAFITTRHGRAIARLIPEEAVQRNGQAKAIERLKAPRAYG